MTVLIRSMTGLDTPLILSSMALDISLDGVCSLIRSYLEDHETWPQGSSGALPDLQKRCIDV